jgi:hypothetical protein
MIWNIWQSCSGLKIACGPMLTYYVDCDTIVVSLNFVGALIKQYIT